VIGPFLAAIIDGRVVELRLPITERDRICAVPGEFSVLFVCTGNVCRSPMAERLFVHRLAERLGEGARAFVATSAGVGALEGDPMTEHAATVLGSLGVEPGGVAAFRGRQLLAEHVASADLVLAATREHRTRIATLVPDAVPRTFTVTEFALLVREVDAAELSAGDPVERARELTRRALGLRGSASPASPQALDVADPYRLSLDVFRDVAGQIDEALTVIADAIAG
jgi:protein-tyrosine phosphatase